MHEKDQRGWHVAILSWYRGCCESAPLSFCEEIQRRANVWSKIEWGLCLDMPMLFFRRLRIVPPRCDLGLKAVMKVVGSLYINKDGYIAIPARNERVELRNEGLWYYLAAALKGEHWDAVRLAERWAIEMQGLIATGQSVADCAQAALNSVLTSAIIYPTDKLVVWAIDTLQQTWRFGEELAKVAIACA